jgi:hypothetical protein
LAVVFRPGRRKVEVLSGERDDPAGRETAVVSRFGKPAIWSGMIALAHTACLLVAMNWAQASRLSDLSKEGLMSYLSRAFLLGLIIFAVSLLIIVMWRSRFMSRRAFGWVSLLVAATGCIIGALMVDIAIDHNPQGAFIDLDSGAVNYVSLSLIFYTWFPSYSTPIYMAMDFNWLTES